MNTKNNDNGYPDNHEVRILFATSTTGKSELAARHPRDVVDHEEYLWCKPEVKGKVNKEQFFGAIVELVKQGRRGGPHLILLRPDYPVFQFVMAMPAHARPVVAKTIYVRKPTLATRIAKERGDPVEIWSRAGSLPIDQHQVIEQRWAYDLARDAGGYFHIRELKEGEYIPDAEIYQDRKSVV